MLTIFIVGTFHLAWIVLISPLMLAAGPELLSDMDNLSGGRRLNLLFVVHTVQSYIGAEGDFGTVEEYIRAAFGLGFHSQLGRQPRDVRSEVFSGSIRPEAKGYKRRFQMW